MRLIRLLVDREKGCCWWFWVVMRKVDNWGLLVDAKCWQLWFMANW